MAYTQERLNEIVHGLLGTCQSFDSVLEDGENATDKELCEAIDAEIFCCDQRGWWFQISESCSVDGDVMCEDCAGE